MFVEDTRTKALEAYLKGKKVLAITETDDGSILTYRLEELLPQDDIHYLVNVPAFVDPEFEQAVMEMEKEYEVEAPNLAAGEPEYQQKEETAASPVTEKPEVKAAESTAEKSKKEICQELKKQGLDTKEISQKTGIAYGTVWYYLNGRKPKVQSQGHNADRHLCKTCQYRSKTKGCDYYQLTDKERGCNPEDCDKYKKGERLK